MKQLDYMKEAWLAGRICLHPTDTLPGLSFSPKNAEAWEALARLKGRDPGKSCIALVSDISMAKEYWQPLPGHWVKVLASLWPAPLSVSWQASSSCPSPLKRDDGTVALRCPSLSSDNQWLVDLIAHLGQPFPTTSVNFAGEKAAQTYQEACKFLKEDQTAYLGEPFAVKGGMPSTLIAISPDGGYQLLREGALDKSVIDKVLSDALSHTGE